MIYSMYSDGGPQDELRVIGARTDEAGTPRVKCRAVDGGEYEYAIYHLRADGGINEIAEAIETAAK